MVNIVIIGPPGSGKSTIGKKIAVAGSMVYVSSGDIARVIAMEDRTTKNNLKNGDMADERLMREHIDSALHLVTDSGKSFVLDGFPRYGEQYEWLKERYDNIKYIILDVSHQTCMDRLSKRNRSDDTNKIIYNRMSYYYNHTLSMMIDIIEHENVSICRNISADNAVEQIINEIGGNANVKGM